MSGACGCCGGAVRGRDPDPWEGRLDGYCYRCALARCDAFPGECPMSESPELVMWREAFKLLSGRTVHRSQNSGARTFADETPVPAELLPFVEECWPSTPEQRERWAKWDANRETSNG